MRPFGALERADAAHLVVAEREIEHVEILGDALRRSTSAEWRR